MTINDCINKFVDIRDKDSNGRYISYDHCRKCFLDNKNDSNKYDLIALNLYAYLASWGILRNSFLMQKDYLFNKPVVEILCKSKYNNLVNYNPYINNGYSVINYIDDVLEIKKEIIDYYKKNIYIDNDGNKHKIDNVTDTLVSKILLGTLGCVPAYDNYLIKGLRNNNISGTFNKKSLNEIVRSANVNKNDIEYWCKILGNLYTPMKIIDMYF